MKHTAYTSIQRAGHLRNVLGRPSLDGSPPRRHPLHIRGCRGHICTSDANKGRGESKGFWRKPEDASYARYLGLMLAF